MNRTRQFLANFIEDESGQDLIEYTLLVAFIGMAAIALYSGGGASLNSIWKQASNQLSNGVIAAS